GPYGLHRLGQHPQNGHLANRELRVEVERERRLERRQDQLVRAQRPLEWMTPQALHELRPPDDDPRLGTPEQLVAGEADEVGSSLQAFARRRLVTERHA